MKTELLGAEVRTNAQEINQTLDPAAEYAKPYTFLPLPASEIMVGIKSGQTWSNGYYTSSGCNEIGIYFDHKFGTTSVPWELVAGFIEENKIWEKKMNDIHQQAEAQLHNQKTKAIGSVTISTESFIDLLYKVHLDGQRRENYAPLASVQHVMEVMRDLPTIVEQDKRKTYDSVKKIGLQQDFFFGTGSGCQAGFCTD